MARSRLPLTLDGSGARRLKEGVASSPVAHFPTQSPRRLTPRTRAIPAATVGSIHPFSAASVGSLRKEGEAEVNARCALTAVCYRAPAMQRRWSTPRRAAFSEIYS
jgi:hypothetical protein